MRPPTPTPETRIAWGSWRLRSSLAGLVFLVVSGVAILLLPFSTGSQVVVLAHTAGGALLLAPLAAYLGPHLRRRWRDRMSHLLLLGWLTGAATVAAMASGVVLTLEALLGTRIDYGWDLLHTVSGLAVLPVLAAHLVTAVRRNRPGEARYVGRRTLEALGLGSLAALVAYAGGGALADPPRRAALPKDYGLRYGSNPFTPSLARTDWLYRADQDQRWVRMLEEVAAAPGPAGDERLRAFLATAEKAHQADRTAHERGETHPLELGGLALDAGRLDALRALLAAPAAERPERAAAVLARVRREAETTRRAFDEQAGIAPEALAGSASCGTTGCHTEIVREWQPSAHRYASRSAFFQLIQKAMADVNGAESTRYCAGCHDPIALFSGAKNLYDEDLSSPGADEGVSCAACHGIVRTDVEGNANFTLSPPVRYLAEEGPVGRFLVRAYPRHHKASYGRPLMGTPELCGACHKQFIDKELNRATKVQLQNQYDAWKGSHWFVADATNPLRADPAKSLTCKDCHMRQVDSEDPVAADRGGKHRHHGFIAANQWLPAYHALPGADRHVRLTEEWLQGKTVLPEIADRWPGGPIVPVAIDAPTEVRAGETVRLRVSLDNAKVGHTFPTGPLDVIQSWVDVRVVQAGREVFRSGAVDEQGFLQPGAFELKAEGVDRAGQLIDKHNLWDMVGARFRRAVHPGTSDTEEFTFECACEQAPAGTDRELAFAAPAGGDLEVTATLRYRKVNQTLLNMLVPEGGQRAPITDMAHATARIRVVPRP